MHRYKIYTHSINAHGGQKTVHLKKQVRHRRITNLYWVLTDYIFKALIFDVIILDEFQNKGLGLKLISLIKNHPDISVSRSQKVTLFR